MPSHRTLLRTAIGALLVVLATSLPSPAGATTRTSLTLTRTSTASPVTGTTVTFTGKAPVSLKGKVVRLQRAVGTRGSWVTLRQTTVPSSGSFHTQGTASGVGINRWRLYLPAGSTTYLSTVQNTTVYRWYYLHDLEYVDSNRFEAAGVSIGGTSYTKSVQNSSSFWYDHNDWREWNLGYKCWRFTAAIGLADNSATGSQVNFSSTLDGATTDWGTKGLGRATSISSVITGGFRIRLDDTYVAGPLGSGDTSGYGAWGNARILCRAQPAPLS